LRVVLVDTNNMDFVNREKDYRFMVGVIGRDFPSGISRI